MLSIDLFETFAGFSQSLGLWRLHNSHPVHKSSTSHTAGLHGGQGYDTRKAARYAVLEALKDFKRSSSGSLLFVFSGPWPQERWRRARWPKESRCRFALQAELSGEVTKSHLDERHSHLAWHRVIADSKGIWRQPSRTTASGQGTPPGPSYLTELPILTRKRLYVAILWCFVRYILSSMIFRCI